MIIPQKCKICYFIFFCISFIETFIFMYNYKDIENCGDLQMAEYNRFAFFNEFILFFFIDQKIYHGVFIISCYLIMFAYINKLDFMFKASVLLIFLLVLMII